MDNSESKDNNKKNLKVIKEIDSELVFDIKKISLDKGNEFIYLKNIISQLEFFLDNISNNNNNSKKIISIKQNLKFFSNYLMNIDKSFFDPNFNINIPIQSRQNNLLNYRILEIISKIIKFFNSSSAVQKTSEKKDKLISNAPIDKSKENRSMQDQLTDLFKEILIFLLCLSENNNKIKKKIFSENMPEVLKLGEKIFDNKSILLFFIFKITKNCPEIQEVIISENELNSKKQKQGLINIYDYGKENIQTDAQNTPEEKESPEDITVSINLNLLTQYIMECSNFYYFFDKILKFKATYPRVNIRNKIEEYFEKNKEKIDNTIMGQCKELAEYDKSNDSNLEYDIKQLKKFLNLVPKFELKKFMFMKQSFLSYLKEDIIVKESEKSEEAVEKSMDSQINIGNLIIEDDKDDGKTDEKEKSGEGESKENESKDVSVEEKDGDEEDEESEEESKPNEIDEIEINTKQPPHKKTTPVAEIVNTDEPIIEKKMTSPEQLFQNPKLRLSNINLEQVELKKTPTKDFIKRPSLMSGISGVTDTENKDPRN